MCWEVERIRDGVRVVRGASCGLVKPGGLVAEVEMVVRWFGREKKLVWFGFGVDRGQTWGRGGLG